MNKVFENCDFCSIQSFLFYLNFFLSTYFRIWLLIQHSFLLMKKTKTLWPLFMDGVQLSQGYIATTRDSLLLISQFLGVFGTLLIDLRRMKDWVDLDATQRFWTRLDELPVKLLCNLYKIVNTDGK